MYVTNESDVEEGHTIRPEDNDMKMYSYQDFFKNEEDKIQN